jgi:hypothetical protein
MQRFENPLDRPCPQSIELPDLESLRSGSLSGTNPYTLYPVYKAHKHGMFYKNLSPLSDAEMQFLLLLFDQVKTLQESLLDACQPKTYQAEDGRILT